MTRRAIEKDVFGEWRMSEVVGRLHGDILYIKGSNQHRNTFLGTMEADFKQERPFTVRLKNDTRWGNT
jgi:hypothetical protein